MTHPLGQLRASISLLPHNPAVSPECLRRFYKWWFQWVRPFGTKVSGLTDDSANRREVAVGECCPVSDP